MKFTAVVLDDRGNSVPDASVSIFDAGTATPATVYSNDTLATALTQPLKTDAGGRFEFWALGRVKVQASKSGYTLLAIDDLELWSPLQRFAAITYSSAGQSIPTDSETKLTFDTVPTSMDPMGFANLANNQLVVPAGHGGHYLVSAYTTLGAGGGDQRRIEVRVNGDVIKVYGARSQFGVGGAPLSRLTTAGVLVDLVAGDTIHVLMFQNSGGALDATGAKLFVQLMSRI